MTLLATSTYAHRWSDVLRARRVEVGVSGTTTTIYEARAEPGASTSDPVWVCRKRVIDESAPGEPIITDTWAAQPSVATSISTLTYV